MLVGELCWYTGCLYSLAGYAPWLSMQSGHPYLLTRYARCITMLVCWPCWLADKAGWTAGTSAWLCWLCWLAILDNLDGYSS
jgi:hypothetical protein